MATINLGSIKFNWRGAYAGGTAYAVDDVVSYNGSSYICILASTGNLPTNGTYFSVMSQAGTDGTDVGTTLTTQGDILYRDGSGLQRLGAGTSGQYLETKGTGANPVWSTNTAGLVKTTWFRNDTRYVYGDVVHRLMFTMPFTKAQASTTMYIQGQIPIVGNNSDAVGAYGIVGGGGSEPSNSGSHHEGVSFIPTAGGNHAGSIIYNQRFTGLAAGSHAFYVGHHSADNTTNSVGVINYNANEDARQQQAGTTFLISEVSV
jgi:hypothetical protein